MSKCYGNMFKTMLTMLAPKMSNDQEVDFKLFHLDVETHLRLAFINSFHEPSELYHKCHTRALQAVPPAVSLLILVSLFALSLFTCGIICTRNLPASGSAGPSAMRDSEITQNGNKEDAEQCRPRSRCKMVQGHESK